MLCFWKEYYCPINIGISVLKPSNIKIDISRKKYFSLSNKDIKTAVINLKVNKSSWTFEELKIQSKYHAEEVKTKKLLSSMKTDL